MDSANVVGLKNHARLRGVMAPAGDLAGGLPIAQLAEGRRWLERGQLPRGVVAPAVHCTATPRSNQRLAIVNRSNTVRSRQQG